MAFIKKDNISADVLGGITAGIMILPAALAYGLTTGLGPTSGILTAVILGLLTAIFGGTNAQISSPTGAMAVVVAFIVTKEIAVWGGLENAMPIVIAIFILTGIFQMLLGFFKLGMNIRYVPFSVVSGFMSGIGIIIIVLQLKDITGVYPEDLKSVPAILMNLGLFIQNIHWETLGLALSVLAIIYFSPRITKKIPGSLIALIVVTTASILLDLDVKRLGEIKLVFPHFDMPFSSIFNDTGTLLRIVLAALSLSILGSIITLLTSVIADKMTQTEHNSNKELLGQGIGNFVAALAGGFPGSAAAPITVANIKTGGRNRLSGLFSALFLLTVLLFGKEIAALIPNAVLGGILMYVGVILIDTETLFKMKKIPRADNVVMVTVLVLTVFWNLLYAVLTGLVFAAFYFMKKMADVVETDTQKTKIDSLVQQVVDCFDDCENLQEQILVKTIRGPIFFGFSSRFLTSMRNTSTKIKAVIFDLSMVPYMDYSGVRTFMEVIQFLNESKINVCFSGVSDANLHLLKGFELIPKMVDEQHIFQSVEEGITWLHQPGHIENKFSSEGKLYIPPAFTPNGDGVNDDWLIKNIEQYPQVEISIQNRKDEVVFESVGYQKPWNGQLDGELLPTGEYIYELKLNDEKEEEISGSVFLFR